MPVPDKCQATATHVLAARWERAHASLGGCNTGVEVDRFSTKGDTRTANDCLVVLLACSSRSRETHTHTHRHRVWISDKANLFQSLDM